MYALAARMLGSREDARDAVQDAFERLLDLGERLDEVKEPGAFCLTMIRRICIDRLRRSTAAVTVPIDTHDAPVEPPSGDTDDSARILRAIDRLPVDQAIVIKLRAIEGLDNRQIEAETGFSPDKVRQALCRARRKLKEILQ